MPRITICNVFEVNCLAEFTYDKLLRILYHLVLVDNLKHVESSGNDFNSWKQLFIEGCMYTGYKAQKVIGSFCAMFILKGHCQV